MSGPTAHRDVMPGAEPFAFPGGDGPDGRTGVLLVHGFTGTPMEYSVFSGWIARKLTR